MPYRTWVCRWLLLQVRSIRRHLVSMWWTSPNPHPHTISLQHPWGHPLLNFWVHNGPLRQPYLISCLHSRGKSPMEINSKETDSSSDECRVGIKAGVFEHHVPGRLLNNFWIQQNPYYSSLDEAHCDATLQTQAGQTWPGLGLQSQQGS